MLRPKSYPEMMGKALVFESEPFITMVEDDNPWVEGLFMVIVVGVAVGLARVIGGLLLTAVLPPPDALLEALLHAWRQLDLLFASAGGLSPAGEATIRQAWALGTGLIGYGGGWFRLGWLVLIPVALLVRWLLFGLIGHGVARALGGTGKLNQTLGATALVAAPHLLLLLTVVPFVSVSGLLLSVWGIVIVYRAVEVAHDLPWTKAAAVAIATAAILFLLALVVGGLVGVFGALVVGGGA
jgi:hypothetical protein